MDEFICANCDHFYVLNKEHAVCKRNPPVPIPIPQQDLTGRVNINIMSVRPPVESHDTCGEFENENTDDGGGEEIPVHATLIRRAS